MYSIASITIEVEVMVKFPRELLKGGTELVVLQILAREPMYGYEMARTLEKSSAGILKLGQGTLYPLLYSLEKKELIEGKREKTSSGRERKYYHLTEKGRNRLEKARFEWSKFAEGVNSVIGEADAPKPLESEV
jgi:PadR family transcriptional regulator